MEQLHLRKEPQVVQILATLNTFGNSRIMGNSGCGNSGMLDNSGFGSSTFGKDDIFGNSGLGSSGFPGTDSSKSRRAGTEIVLQLINDKVSSTKKVILLYGIGNWKTVRLSKCLVRKSVFC
ncbi:hypothetical protein V6N13_101288 [Hibiscus sabdariffa]|uniref:Uncharacterized protein n=1 Tax=Hibiscus sabdariffa TaxID=183260 RepID=A0ABR2QL38_9ROSI